MPADHLLRRITAAVDLSFVTELVSDCYCPDHGRPSGDPLLLFKVVFLQFLYHLSDRPVEEQVNLQLACQWFGGLQSDETGGGFQRPVPLPHPPGTGEVRGDLQPNRSASAPGGVGVRPAADP